jgi:hypothetical protein
MTNEEFVAIARALNGASGWQTAFADASGYSVRAINRVASGAVKVTRSMRESLVHVAEQRVAEVNAAAELARKAVGD